MSFQTHVNGWCSETVNALFYFFLQHTHYPQYAGPEAAGRSLRGPFGDALLEFDNTIGNLMTTLEKTGVINNTLVFFTSDNGLRFDFFSKCANPFILSYGDVLRSSS